MTASHSIFRLSARRSARLLWCRRPACPLWCGRPACLLTALIIHTLLLFSPAPAQAQPATSPSAAPSASQPAASQPTSRPAESAAASAPARDPLGGLPSYGESLKKMITTLVVIVIALLAAGKLLPQFLRTRRPTHRGKIIGLIETNRLEPRKALHLVRVANEYYLIGSSGDRLETLAGPIDADKITAVLESSVSKSEDRDRPIPEPGRPFSEILKQK